MDYRQLAYQTAQRYGIDPDLFVRQIQAESSFRPDAVSAAGAIGLGQLMPSTAKELGVDPNDPVQNLEGAARYMRQQLDRFGDPALALAAYNAGPDRVVKANGIPNIKETQNYVAKILGGKGGAAMNQQPQQSQGLLGGLLGGQGIGSALGLSEDLADKLAIAVMAGTGDPRLTPLVQQRAASMQERKEEKKLQKGINKTKDYFQKKADAGDDLAATMLGALSTGQIDPASAISTYVSESTRVTKDSRSTSEKDYDRAVAGGYEGSFMDFLQAKKKEFNVDINTAGADDFSKALMKEMAKRYETYQTEADAAERTMSNLTLMDNIAQQDDFYSGFGAETLLRARRAAIAFGADPDLVSDAETFNKIAKDSALQVMGGSLGVGFSNADREFVEAMVPNITNTIEGNRKIIAVQKKLQNRKIQLARLAEQYVDQNGTLKGFRGFIMDWSEQNPLFSTEDKTALDPSATAKTVGGSDLLKQADAIIGLP